MDVYLITVCRSVKSVVAVYSGAIRNQHGYYFHSIEWAKVVGIGAIASSFLLFVRIQARRGWTVTGVYAPRVPVGRVVPRVTSPVIFVFHMHKATTIINKLQTTSETPTCNNEA